jgi:CheY-like chemotaxis protein
MGIVDVRKKFGTAVREHRLELGLSQESLAERAELHRTYVTDVERGARNVSLQSISKLAKALEVSIGTLFTSSEVPKSAGAQSVDLLIVEDDPRDLELTLAVFKKARLSNPVKVVRDGAEALNYLFGRGEYAPDPPPSLPAVVLLDLGLPRISGMEVLRQIKANDSTRFLRVIVLTGLPNDRDLGEALRLGADAYLVKPVDFHAFSSVAPQLELRWMLLDCPKEPVRL